MVCFLFRLFSPETVCVEAINVNNTFSARTGVSEPTIYSLGRSSFDSCGCVMGVSESTLYSLADFLFENYGGCDGCL